MKTRSTILLVASLLLTLLAPNLLATSSSDETRGWIGHGRILERLATRLEVTQDQRIAIREALEAHRGLFREDLKTLREAREAVRSAVETGDEATIREAHQQLGMARSRLAVQWVTVRQEIRSTLTAEQLERLDQLKESFRSGRESRRALRGLARGFFNS